MLNETIRAALGDELAARVERALRGRGRDGRDLELVVGNDGSYVPAEKYELAAKERLAAQEKLKDAARALGGLGGSGEAARFCEDVAAVQEAVRKQQEAHQAELPRIRKDAAVRAALHGKVYDPQDVLALIDLDAVPLDESGAVPPEALEQALGAVWERKPYLFLPQQDTQQIVGAKPAEPAPRQDEGMWQVRTALGI